MAAVDPSSLMALVKAFTDFMMVEGWTFERGEVEKVAHFSGATASAAAAASGNQPFALWAPGSCGGWPGPGITRYGVFCSCQNSSTLSIKSMVP